MFVDLNLSNYQGLDLVPLIKRHNNNVNIVVWSIDLGNVFLTTEHANDLKYYRESLSQVLIAKHLRGQKFETLGFLSKGYSNKLISEHMGIAESTVKKYVTSLMDVFNAENRTHCVTVARELNIIEG